MGDFFKNIGSVISSVSEALNSDSAKQVINAISGNADIATGLKTALKVGIEAAAKSLGQEDGYLADAAVRIGLPKEAVSAFGAVQSLSSNAAFNSILNATGIQIPSYDTIIKLFNRAAESAAPKSVDVFVNAITGMSINDAENILFGADNAATNYLKDNTFKQLQSAFIPSISNSLDTVMIANITPTSAWNTYATYNNKLVDLMDSSAVKTGLQIARMTGVLGDEQFEKLSNIDKVSDNLSDYVTTQALDGLFLKVSEKESDIRHNAGARVNDVLKSVFGRLDGR